MSAPGSLPQSRVELRRSVSARLFSGFWLQPFLTAIVVLDLALAVFVFGVLGVDPGPAVLGQLLPTVALLVVWGLGVTASAHADGNGLTWRYFRRHDVAWSAADEVRYGSTFVPSAKPTRTRPTIFVRAGGVEHPIVPAYGCPPGELARFADALAGLAAAHGVRTESTSARWDGLGELPGVARSPHGSPGRVVSRELHRLRIRLSGLAFLVVAALALAGAFTGWDATGVGERVVFGVIGLLFVPIGLLLLASPGN